MTSVPMDPGNIKNKLKYLFKMLTEPGYVLDNYYGDSIINKLSAREDPDVLCLEKLPLISDLLIDALEKVDNAHITVKVFIIRLFSIMSNHELHFTKMYCKNTSTKIEEGFSQILSPEIKPSLRVAYIELALALVNHTAGINWLFKTGTWRNILNLCNDKQTVFIVRQTYKFTGKFLWKLNDIGDEENIVNVVNQIITPLNSYDYMNMTSLTAEEEEEHVKVLEPMLHMLQAIFNENASRIYQPTMLLDKILNQYKLSNHLHILIDRLRTSKHLNLLAAKLIFWLAISKCFVSKPLVDGIEYERQDLIETAAVYFNMIKYFMVRRWPTTVLDFCNACNMSWAQIWKGRQGPSFVSNSGEKVLIQHKLIFIQIVPIIVYVKKKDKNYSSHLTDETLDHYVTKLLRSSCEHTARAAYAMRDLMMETDPLEITLQSVKRLSCLKNHLDNEQANMIFQALFYVLQDFDPVDDSGDCKPEEHYEASQEKTQVMTYVMDTVLLLVKNYDIHWHRSIEVICLYTIVYSILKRPNLSCKFVVTALNVIALTIKKFLPPNLSLLLETKPGSPIHELGRLIYTKMHDLNWEVRDTALELMHVVTTISFMKFPPFQKQILENNLIIVTATIAMNDHEQYVQASALKCLAAATRVHSVWEQLSQEQPKILEKIIEILRNNQEGIVRKEAVNVLCEIFQNVKLGNTCKQCLFEHMVSTALTDFHWEVQIAALEFWMVVIHSLLTDQGMLDGTFPPVTFSKETRKIVTLNEQEIQKRMLKVLDELATIGCLTVLVKLLQEDVEIEIIETALGISDTFIDTLNKYKVLEVLKLADGNENIDEILSHIEVENCDPNGKVEVPEQPVIISEEVIEGILNSDDINLLANIYESGMSLQNDDGTEASNTLYPKIKLSKRVPPSLFVNFLGSKDFKAMIEQKRQWRDGIRNLASLLDDALGIYDVSGEVNTMDCY